MNSKIQKLEDLSALLKSNAITKEEFETLKSELLSDTGGDISAKSRIDDSYSKRVATTPSLETQSINRTSAFAKNDNIVGKALLGIGLLFVLGIATYRMNNPESTNSINPSNSPSSNSNSYEHSQKSSTMANCVVCGKRVDYYQENTFSGHHLIVGGLMSSDVVCGLECDIKLRRRNERIINKEIMDPNSYHDPVIKYPNLNK